MMAPVCLSTTPTWKPSSPLPLTQKHDVCSFQAATSFRPSSRSRQAGVCYYGHHLDTPIEFEQPRAPRRPDVFRPLTPLERPPLPPPLPYDPREEDEFAEEGEIEERMKQLEPENRAHDYDE